MRNAFVAIALLTATAGPAPAVVLGGAIIYQTGYGDFVKLETTEPFSVGADNFNTDHLYAFDEDQNIALKDPVRVDIGGTNGLIAAGTIVASHYVFFDSFNGVHQGYVDFDAPILGIATLRGTMEATDFLANTRVNYISTQLRGLEDGDMVWIDDNDPHRLWVFWGGFVARGLHPGLHVQVARRIDVTKKEPPVGLFLCVWRMMLTSLRAEPRET